ncbi:MAG: putative sugar nucleotidyl transferase [Planctomycetia bacterium]|nr:putative sugar nucleotidyl transferase [Planctomycetia bacterium]
MKIVLFEDHLVEQLYPITVGRGAFAITCGTFRIIDLLEELSRSLYVLCRPYLEGISRLEYPAARFGLSALREDLENANPDELVLVVNARMVPNAEFLEFLASFRSSEPLCWQDTLAAVVYSTAELLEMLDGRPDDFYDLSELCAKEQRVTEHATDHSLELFDFPHDIVRENMALFNGNLECRLQKHILTATGRAESPKTDGSWKEIRDGVFVGKNVRVGEYLVTDTTQGPILIDEGASVGPFCFLKGPVYVGPYSKIIEHAALKDYVGMTHTTKVGGEVEASTIEPYTNKQHHGFLGHSYLGSWINLGAGTCNSDLKNTYGTVSMTYDSGRVATTMQFHGCIIGDYSKTAINTSIFTGKIIGSCSMIYGFVTRNVPSFVNYARSFNQCTELPVEVMISTQKRMFARRNVAQTLVHVELLHKMFALTQSERQMENEPLSL